MLRDSSCIQCGLQGVKRTPCQRHCAHFVLIYMCDSISIFLSVYRTGRNAYIEEGMHVHKVPCLHIYKYVVIYVRLYLCVPLELCT